MGKHLAIIPARKGSKRVKDKNITKLQGKTLIEIITEKVVDSRLFSKVILTTDYTKNEACVTDISPNAYTSFEYIKRPPELASDTALMVDVIKNVLLNVGKEFSYIWIFQPTCPFTKVEDIKNIMEMIESHPEIKSVITMKEVKEHSNRFYTLKEKEDYIEAYKLRYTSFEPAERLIKQYIRSGNIYVFDLKSFEESNCVENKIVAAYFVDRIIGSNIDDIEDLVLVKYWLNGGYIKI